MNRKSSTEAGVTLRDIGRSLGISHVTVSLALRDAPQIPLTRRQQIREAAVRMGYRPNPMAAALGQLRSTGKAQAVTAELAWINHWPNPKELLGYREFALYWKGAAETAAWYGYRLAEFVCDPQFTLARLEKVLVARGVTGILIPPHRSLPAGWKSFPWEHFSAVRFGHSIAHPAVHMAASDQSANTLLAVDRMRELGYERIGFVSGHPTQTRHLGGYLMGQSELAARLHLPPLILHADQGGEQKVLARWLKKWRPDAILTDVARMREMLGRAGCQVPETIGLAACSVLDGNADAGIYQNPEEIGKAATELLISLINHHQTGVPEVCRKVLIEGKWVDGKTLPRKAGRSRGE